MELQYRSQERVKLKRVVSRIERRAYVNGNFRVILYDTRLELWYGPCSNITFKKICRELSTANYWQWEYNSQTYELHNWVSVDWSCVVQ